MLRLRTITTNALVLAPAALVSLGVAIDRCSPDVSGSGPCCRAGNCALDSEPSDTDLGASISSTCTAVCCVGAALPSNNTVATHIVSANGFSLASGFFFSRFSPPDPYPPRSLAT